MLKKVLFPLLLSSLVVLPTSLTLSCSSTTDLENDKNADVNQETYLKLYNQLVIAAQEPFNKTNALNSSFFNGTKESLKALNELIAKEINKSQNQNVLKVFLLKDMNSIFQNIFNENGIAINLGSYQNNYKVYTDLIADDTPTDSSDEGKDSQTFKKLQTLIDSIENIEIKIMNNYEINSIDPKFWWEYSYSIKEGSDLLTVFQNNDGTAKQEVIVRNIPTTKQRAIINEQKTPEKKELAEKYFSYQSTTRYWDNNKRKIISVPLQSNFNLYENGLVESGYVSKGTNQTRSFFALDFKKINEKEFKFYIKFSTKNVLDNVHTTSSVWKNYFAKENNKNLLKDVYVDLNLPILKIIN